jgi:urease accessory protein
LAALAPLSYPVAWAVAGSHLALSARDTVIGLLWGFVENQAGALMKALPMGQTAAQRMLLALGPRVEAAADLAMRRASCAATDPHPWGVAERCAAEGAGSGGIAGAMPGLAIASMLHETQYSRLFRS